MSKRRYLLALSVPLLMLTVAFSTRTTAATPTTTGTGAPGFTVWPTYGGPPGNTTSPDCNGAVCWVILGNPANASASLSWDAVSNQQQGANGGPVTFTPASGILKPGQHVKVLIHNNPCEDGGNIWYFTGAALSYQITGNALAMVPNSCG
jgi:hypothetical protein